MTNALIANRVYSSALIVVVYLFSSAPLLSMGADVPKCKVAIPTGDANPIALGEVDHQVDILLSDFSQYVYGPTLSAIQKPIPNGQSANLLTFFPGYNQWLHQVADGIASNLVVASAAGDTQGDKELDKYRKPLPASKDLSKLAVLDAFVHLSSLQCIMTRRFFGQSAMVRQEASRYLLATYPLPTWK